MVKKMMSREAKKGGDMRRELEDNFAGSMLGGHMEATLVCGAT
jgi:hypothetical protein